MKVYRDGLLGTSIVSPIPCVRTVLSGSSPYEESLLMIETASVVYSVRELVLRICPPVHRVFSDVAHAHLPKY